MSAQLSSPPAPGQGVGVIGVRAPIGHDTARRPGLSTARPFAALPHDLIGDARLKATDVRLAGVVLRYARAKPTAWPSVKTLAADLGRCERTIQYSLKRLAEAGWIVSRPDPNPTGRVLVLTWREARCTPGVQAPYSQGLPRTKPVAPESETGREREVSAPAVVQRKAAERPMTHAELLVMYAETGWLNRLPNDPLRRIADRSLAAALETARGAPSGQTRSRGLNRPPTFLTGNERETKG